MENIGWIAWIIIGGFAGWVAERVMKGSHGLVTNIVLGILGAVVFNWILRQLNFIPPDGYLGQFIVAVLGACLLIFGYRLIRGRAS